MHVGRGEVGVAAGGVNGGAEVVSDLPKILTDYAGELRGAQADHAAGVAAAALTRASLAQDTTAMTGASAMDEGPEQAVAMRLSGQAQAYATEAVASSHTIDAALAREHVADEAAATAVATLTALLAGFTPSDPGQSLISVCAVEAADGYSDTGPPAPAAAKPDEPRTAFDVMAEVNGEGPAGIDLSDQEQNSSPPASPATTPKPSPTAQPETQQPWLPAPRNGHGRLPRSERQRSEPSQDTER